jgi:hypothetical protein
MSLGAVHLVFHPCTTLQGIPAKANKIKGGALIMKKKPIVFVMILAALFVFTTPQSLLAGERTVKLMVPGCV